MAATSSIALSGLARRLVRDGVLNEQDAQSAQQEAARDKVPFVSYLVSHEMAHSAVIAEAASAEFGTPLYDLNSFNLELLPNGLVDNKLISRHHALPLFKRGKRLYLALSDPTNLRALDEIKFHTGLNVDAVVVDEGVLAETLNRFLESQEEPLGASLADFDESGLDNL